METKYVSNYAALETPNTYINVNSPIVSSTQWGSALPQLPQGLTAYDRIGDRVNPTSLKVAMNLRLTAAAQTTPHDLTVVIYYGYCKKFTYYTDVVTNSIDLSDKLLRLGGQDGASQELAPFSGIQSDACLPINKTIWALKKKTIRFYKAPGVLNGTTGAGVLSVPNKNNHTVILDYTSMLPAKLKYDDSDDVWPSNFAPVWSIGYYYNDGTAPDTGTGIVEYRDVRQLYYKDS